MKKILLKYVDGGTSVFNLDSDEQTQEYYNQLKVDGEAQGIRLVQIELLDVTEKYNFVTQE